MGERRASVRCYLTAQEDVQMAAEQDSAPIEAALTALGATPLRLQALAAGSPEPRWRAQPLGDGWTAIEILAHLRAADEILAPRLTQIAVHAEPFLIALDERQWAEVVGFSRLTPAQLAHGLAARRKELLHWLRRLPAADWQRTGVHEAQGPVTLLTVAHNLAAHEAEHLDQIASVLAGPA